MRNKIILLMLLSIITAFSYQESYEVLAHFEEIDVTFDACVPLEYEHGNDGINEKWYNIFSNSKTDHISYQQGTIPTIRYYVSPSVINDYDNNQIDNATWSTNTTLAQGELIKESYVNSMKKWDSIYYYKTEDSMVTKTKLVNFIEVNDTSYNLIIFPYYDDRIGVNVNTAEKSYDGTEVEIGNFNGATHIHYSLGRIGVNIHVNKDCQPGDMYLERTGAHEFGHILGLDDIDRNEKSATINYHHSELLMGYEEPRQTEITYKDLAGTLVAMGFHTSSDHKWMYTEDSNIVDPETGNIIINDGYKLICSICNGVKYTTSIPEGSVEYLSCGGNHSLTSNHMIAVASYGTKDYYKCKYCRYVAPFELNVEQSYGVREYISGNTLQHYAHSNNGLTYKILENHYSDYESNIYQQYSINDIRYSTKHIVRCGCSGVQMKKMHVFTSEDVNDGNTSTTCIDCNAVITNSGPGIVGPLNKNIWQVTDNGSYKLTNGIIILVEEDIDSYKEGTLEFKDPNSEIM